MKRLLSLLVMVTLTACGGGKSAEPTFQLSTLDTTTVKRADSFKTIVNVVGLNGFSAPVTFSVSGLPAGASATFSPESVTPTASFTPVNLTLTAAASTPRGSYDVTIKGTGGSQASMVTKKLIVDWAEAEVPKVTMRSEGGIAEALVTSNDPVAKVEWYFQGELKATNTSAPYTFNPVFTQTGTYDYVIKAVVTDIKGASATGQLSGQVTVH